LFISGCQQSAKKEKNNMVTVEDGSRFPKFLVGTWKADDFIWQIELGKDGRILSLIHVMWNKRIDIEQGYHYKDGPEEGSYAYFELGKCEGGYEPITRKFKLNIVMKEFELRIPNASLKGRGEDFFDGTVSEDGQEWHMDWRSYSYLEGASPPDVNYINANPQKITFKKIDAKQVSTGQ
jgi:hypothetical protein